MKGRTGPHARGERGRILELGDGEKASSSLLRKRKSLNKRKLLLL